jgi:hypothetical protein
MGDRHLYVLPSGFDGSTATDAELRIWAASPAYND